MAVPKKKKSRSRSRMRRAHIRVAKPALTSCSHCKALIGLHQACPFCGYYKGKEVVAIV